MTENVTQKFKLRLGILHPLSMPVCLVLATLLQIELPEYVSWKVAHDDSSAWHHGKDQYIVLEVWFQVF